MKRERCTIAVFGLFGSSNLGNEATLAAFLQNMRPHLPEAGIVAITPHRFAVDQMHGLKKLAMDAMTVERAFWRIKPEWLRRVAVFVATVVGEPIRRRRAIESLKGVRVLYVPGTGVIDDFGQRTLDLPLHLDRWTAAAAAVGARVVFVSIGVSTVQDWLSRLLFKRSLRRSAYCSFRDAVSRENARALGYDGNLIVPDLAFSLRQTVPTPDIAWPPRTIGIGVMGYFGWNLPRAEGERVYQSYIEKIRALIGRLIERGYAVRLLIGDSWSDQRAWRDLSGSFTSVGHAKSGPRLTASTLENYDEVITEIALCDIVVATRYHNVLFALLAGRPTVSIGYSDKNEALMRSLNQAAYCNAIETLEVDAIVAQLSEIAAANQPALSEQRSRTELMRNEVVKQYQTLVVLAR